MNNLLKTLKLMEKIYLQKNKAYGDSFSTSLDKYGPIAFLARASDKFGRMEHLILNPSTAENDERLEDTIFDLGVYCAMMYTYLQEQKNKKNES